MAKNCPSWCPFKNGYCRNHGESKAVSIPSLLKKAESVCNLFIRLRDKDKPCICGCGERVEHAGHFFPKNYSGVRYDELNLNGQARSCNFFGNSAIDPNYETGMIARFGMAAVRELSERAEATKFKKWERSELLDIIEYFTDKINSLKAKRA